MREIWVEILVEEPSMENFLRVILPKILPEDIVLDGNCFIRKHQGKQDLQKSIPQKARAFSHWHVPAKLIIIHDQDSNDCIKLKQKLIDLIEKNGEIDKLVRIACRELEAFYIGDLYATQQVYPKIKADKLIGKKKFRNPDNLNAADELEKLDKSFQKGWASRNIPKHMDLNNNRSASFNHLVSGIQRFLQA